MKLADLTLEDGQSFLDSIEHAYHGGQISPATKKGYKCALRSLTRFLANSSLVQEDALFRTATGLIQGSRTNLGKPSMITILNLQVVKVVAERNLVKPA